MSEQPIPSITIVQTINPDMEFKIADTTQSITVTPQEQKQHSSVDKELRTETSREFHRIIGDMIKNDSIDLVKLATIVPKAVKFCPSTVTTHLLYLTDMKGINRPDIFCAVLNIMIPRRPGYTFMQTLIRGLVRQDAWKLITLFIRDDVSSRVIKYAMDVIVCNIRKHNRKCLRDMPRQGRVANRIRGYMKMKPAKWRHILANGSRGSVVSFMSSNDWTKLNYDKVSIYNLSTHYRAFMRHDKTRFQEFLKQHPDTVYLMKRCKTKKKEYLSQKEIYDTYFVPQFVKKGEKSCQTSKPISIA